MNQSKSGDRIKDEILGTFLPVVGRYKLTQRTTITTSHEQRSSKTLIALFLLCLILLNRWLSIMFIVSSIRYCFLGAPENGAVLHTKCQFCSMWNKMRIAAEKSNQALYSWQGLLTKLSQSQSSQLSTILDFRDSSWLRFLLSRWATAALRSPLAFFRSTATHHVVQNIGSSQTSNVVYI